MNEHEELQNAIRDGRVQTTRSEDDRILARVAAELGRSRSRRHLARALFVAAAASVVALVAFAMRGPEPDPEEPRTSMGVEGTAQAKAPESKAPESKSPESENWGVTEKPAANEAPDQLGAYAPKNVAHLGWPRSVGIDETLRDSDLIAKLTPIGDVAWTGRSGLLKARVIQVLTGDASLEGQTIKVHSNPFSNLLPISARSFLCVRSVSASKAKDVCWLLPLKKKGNDYRNAFSEGLQGTRVPAKRATAKGAKPEAAIRDELLAALDAQNADIRHDAISALRNWDGMNLKKPSDRLWKDRDVAARLLRAAFDPDERVRWTLAWMIPDSAGKAGEDVLLRLLFDPSRMVRQPANHQLGRRGHDEIAAAMKQITDYPLDEKLGKIAQPPTGRKMNARALQSSLRRLSTHARWQTRADQAWGLGHQDVATDVTEALLRSLQEDAHFEVRRWAAWSLGRVAEESVRPSVITALVNRAGNAKEDGRVRVMAAISLRALGDARGYDSLVTITSGEDTRAAVQALESLAADGSKLVLDVLLAATRDKRAVVRAYAGVHLPAYRSFAQHQIDSKLADLAKDRSALVRAASAVASREMRKPR